MVEDNMRRLTSEEKAALTIWRERVEVVLAGGGAVYNELMFWLAPMGAVFSGGILSFPKSTSYTDSAPWTDIEHFFNNIHAWNYGTAVDAGYKRLINTYPLGTNLLTVLNALYNRVYSVLVNNNVTGYQAIIGGLLVLFETFCVYGTRLWGTDWHMTFYTIHSTVGTVGPYTVSINYCNNGVIFGITSNVPYHTSHQSLPAELLLQDEVQRTLLASEALAAGHKSELQADEALQGTHTIPIDADMALQGDVQNKLVASLAIQDKVKTTLPADELLAYTRTVSLQASERLSARPLTGLDADICLMGRATTTLIATIVLVPDRSSEMFTEIERYSIQKFRIKGDPRPYPIFNSAKDKEVGP
jgi:hypothetical protein